MQYLKYERLLCLCSKPCLGIFWACLYAFSWIDQSKWVLMSKSCSWFMCLYWVQVFALSFSSCFLLCELPRWSPRFLIMPLSRLDYANLAFMHRSPSTIHGTEALFWLAKISRGDIIDRLWRWMSVRQPLNVTSPFPAPDPCQSGSSR